MLRCRILEPVITATYRLSALLVPKGAAAVHFCRHSRHSRAAVLVACVCEYTVVSAVPNLLLYVPAWPSKLAPVFDFASDFYPPPAAPRRRGRAGRLPRRHERGGIKDARCPHRSRRRARSLS